MIDILYRDRDLIVCVKPVGVLAQEGEGENMPALLRAQTGCHYIAAVHRLDLTTGGVMVYACNERAAALLSRAVAEHALQKEYLALVHGLTEPARELTDLLYHDRRLNKSFVVTGKRKDAKEARLSYRTEATRDDISLLHITLHTGRTHQIRVQFSSRQHPLLGDGKYGARDHYQNIALWAHRLSFVHPVTGAPLSFASFPPDTTPWDTFSAFLSPAQS